MKQTEIYKLMSRYVSKTLTPSEWEALRDLLNHTDDECLSEVLENLWMEFSFSPEQIPPESELAAIFAKIRRHTASTNIREIVRYAGRVAVILLIVFLTGVSGYLYKDHAYRVDLGAKEVVVDAARGQKIVVTLPDSSVVYLNSESSLRYRQDFGYKDRKVSFKGEAFFQVHRDEARKFVVGTEHLNAEVLGTDFNFYAYEDEQVVELSLIAGSVKVETKGLPLTALYVKPHEKVIYDKLSGNLRKEKANIRFETAWVRGELMFRSEPIENVFYKIERRFGVLIYMKGEGFGSDRFTGYFAYDDVRDVMNDLKMHYKFTYKMEGENIWIDTGEK
ncbi:MAG: FecR domain-containing protein [Tannerella sp.]|jgi:ferric-dicitrate binding protein FerR (iron transport regulator)|nr:FecR domain-containing protein [Tannerella sp.]